jgi:hypothetical protein
MRNIVADPRPVRGKRVNRHQAAMDEGVDGALAIAAEVSLDRDGEALAPDALHVHTPVADGGRLPALAANDAQMLRAILLSAISAVDPAPPKQGQVQPLYFWEQPLEGARSLILARSR